jgi:hypothetical protein
VTDAQLALERVERLARLPSADRRRLAEAAQLKDRVGQLYQQGKTHEALPLAQKARELIKDVLGDRHPDYATSLNNLALLYRARGEYAKAEPLFRQALVALRQRPEGPPMEFGQLTAADLRPLPDTVSVLASYCVLLEQRLGPRPTTAQLRAADQALALAVRERLRQEVLHQDASKLHHGAEALNLIARRIGLCQRLFDEEGRVADLETALTTAEQGTARVFLEQLGKARALSVGGVSIELRTQEAGLRRLREFDTRIAKEQDKPFEKRDADKVGQLLDEQKKVEAQLTELIRRMEQDSPQYAALKYPKPCSLAQARACLAPTEVALLFVPGKENSYLVCVDGQPAPGDKAHGLAIYPLPGQDDLADGARDDDGGINDGFLRLDEVTRLHLNADLVVLSACETGKGRLYAGEGVTGLARAFLYAGSRGVVASLWAVDDRETAGFMAQLYGGLKDGQAAADALRAAKLEMIRGGKPPVYWARSSSSANRNQLSPGLNPN